MHRLTSVAMRTNGPFWVVLSWLVISLGCQQQNAESIPANPDAGFQYLRKAKVLFIQGKVKIKRAGSMEWTNAKANMQMTTADKLRTLPNSFATIEFESGGILRIGPESLVSLTNLQIEPRKQIRRVVFTLKSGQIEAEFNPIENRDSELKIRTPSAETSILHREVAFQ